MLQPLETGYHLLLFTLFYAMGNQLSDPNSGKLILRLLLIVSVAAHFHRCLPVIDRQMYSEQHGLIRYLCPILVSQQGRKYQGSV